ncbi:vanadium-dependent haloperoxidase [Haloferula sp. BvORR071]|uniref:vanadium-dependent haloperoxidase n=1 Tax=Haloferula sp. BvORR071 TaxID=1396141 RepID=UPI0006981B59|nr:vanadium-dependent haloperoxidase [Haloferula sp. BvORR071]
MKPRSSSLILAGTLLAGLGSAARADVITDWNLYAIQVSKAGVSPISGAANPFTGSALNTNLATRIHAIEAIAVYNAVNSIIGFGTAYGSYSTPAAPGASPAAAAAQAARDVLVNYFPSQQTGLDARLATSLATIPAGQAKTDGIAAGSAAAAHIIALRSNDGSAPNSTYPGPAGPGVGTYQLTPNIPGAATPPFTFNPGINFQWKSVTPFVLATPSQYRPEPPPAVGSPRYVKALNQVKVYGDPTNPRHTAELNSIANFYRLDAEILVNEIGRKLSQLNSFNLAENALLFAQLDIGAADIRIAEWDAKYFYLSWRPITALNADPSGAVTNNYSAWKPTLVTPNHPSYPSGHSGTVSGLEILRSYFDDDLPPNFTITTTTGEPARVVSSLRQIEADNGLSRIYGGIHFSYDNEAGQALGRAVAADILAHGPRLLP